MHKRHSRALLGIATTAVATGLVFSFSATPAQAESIEIGLHEAVAALPIADENRDGYDRDKFNHWTDEDGDGCNTRYEVLIAEAVEAPTVGDGCSLSGGSWYSYYDGAEWTDPADLDIDHFVPLAEAWDSGAYDWTAAEREGFANDLGDDRDLVAVTDNENQEKSDQDPQNWMPDLEHCRYIAEWAVVKTRWRLSVDEAEKAFLTTAAADCANETLTIEYAR